MTKNKKWDEKRIKALLIDYLMEKDKKHIICSEVPFLGGKRWVDILEIKENSLTAYEIKSDLDSLINLNDQLTDYVNTFNETYVILSKKFAGKHKDLPRNIGYFWIDPTKEKIILKRKSKKRVYLSKKNLSYFLWKQDIPKNLRRHNESIDLIRDRFMKSNTVKFIQNLAIKALKKRYIDRFKLFLKEKSDKTHFSEINVLTKKEINIG